MFQVEERLLISRKEYEEEESSNQHVSRTNYYTSWLPLSVLTRRIKRTAELEERIQNLAALLASQQQATLRSVPPTPQGQTNNASSSHSFQANNLNTPLRIPQAIPSTQDSWTPAVPLRPNADPALLLPPPRTCDFRAPYSTSQPTPSIPSLLDTKDGDYLLRIYREHFSRRFPFIVIPPNLSAEEFRTQRPWLFKAVIMTASQDNRSQQVDSAKDLITELALAMVVKAEKSLDMLQSLVICKLLNLSFKEFEVSK